MEIVKYLTILSISVIIASQWSWGREDMKHSEDKKQTSEKWRQISTKEKLVEKLTPLQFKVTQKDATEPPFKNEFWDNKRPGIYVDIVSGEPLFSSNDKFDSGTGWPSFTQPIEEGHISYHSDKKLFFAERTEVRSKVANSHLGHVFDDGPAPTGKRYCINSASLRFIPADQLQTEGYENFADQFVGVQSPKSFLNASATKGEEVAVFGGGCFWGVEDLIRKLPGVISTEVGYAGGSTDAPSYDTVKKGITGHAEVVKVVFDPKLTSYEDILRYFFRIHDPTTLNKQGNDVGTQYRSIIIAQNLEQKKSAKKVIEEINSIGYWKKPIVTQVVENKSFTLAESYHQDYLQKNPGGYTCHYERKF